MVHKVIEFDTSYLAHRKSGPKAPGVYRSGVGVGQKLQTSHW